MDKYAREQFIVAFRATTLFQSFLAYYRRIKGENDPSLKRMHEGHGKHFARRQAHAWESDQFDRKLYDREIFKISRDKIVELEAANQGNTKERVQAKMARERPTEFPFPTPEFEMLGEAKDFLRAYVWKSERRPSRKRTRRR